MVIVVPFLFAVGFTSETVFGGNKKAAGFSQRPLGDLRREICLRREPQEALSGALRKALVIGHEGCHCVAPHRRGVGARTSTSYATNEGAVK